MRSFRYKTGLPLHLRNGVGSCRNPIHYEGSFVALPETNGADVERSEHSILHCEKPEHLSNQAFWRRETRDELLLAITVNREVLGKN